MPRDFSGYGNPFHWIDDSRNPCWWFIQLNPTHVVRFSADGHEIMVMQPENGQHFWIADEDSPNWHPANQCPHAADS